MNLWIVLSYLLVFTINFSLSFDWVSIIFKLSGEVLEKLDDNLDVTGSNEKKILKHVSVISNELNDLIGRVENNMKTPLIFKTLNELPLQLEFKNYISNLNEICVRINVAYTYFSDYNTYSNELYDKKFENWTILNFAESVVSHDSHSIRSSLANLYELIHPDEAAFMNDNLFDFFIDSFKKLDSAKCTLQQSPSQFIQGMYQLISITEIKGHAVMEFSYALLKSFSKGDFKEEKILECQKHRDRLNGITKATIAALKESSRQFYRCDPIRFEKGNNYEEITELLQGYIENEVDMNKEDTCRETCSYYTDAENHGCLNSEHCQSFKRRCKGRIRNCRFIESDMNICPSKNPELSHRRYDYIKYDSNDLFGRFQKCQNDVVKTESWWRWLFWHCSYCMCLCDEQGVHSDRYFALNEVTSDVQNNKVITGLKFTKKNRIIFLQIQQGKLLSNGSIDKSTVKWVPIPDIYINGTKFKEGKDYFALTYNSRSIDLDELEHNQQHLLTGVRFKLIGSHLNFQIQVTPFDFATGKLDVPYQFWIQNLETEVSENPRRKISLNDRDVPTRSTGYQSFPDSESNEYVEFTHTGFKRDVAQTTVPFIDTQEVSPMIITPLTGAGLYHRGQSDLGGFIAPKIITYDLSDHLSKLDFQTKRKCDKIVNTSN